MPPDDEVQKFAQLLPDMEPTPGGRSTFTTEQFRLSHEAEKARGSAMELLGKALNNQPEITPSQGFAAALLGAIPTIGGYMLGNAVGRPNIPQGTYFKGVSPSEFNKEFGSSGANYGGQQGAAIGGNAAQGYFDSREEEIKQQIPVLAKQAAIEEDRAQQLDQQAQTMNLHGLDAEEWRDRLPLQAQKEMDVQDHQAAVSTERAKEVWDYQLKNPKPDPMAEYRNKMAETNRLRLEASIHGGKAENPSQGVFDKVAAADAVEAKQERLRELYQNAAQQLGPGFIQAFIRKGVDALPANAQREFLGTLKSVAMELNKAVDPTPSDAGMQAQYQKLLSSVETGHFFDALDFEVKNARTGALAALKPFTVGTFPNAQAQSIHNVYQKKWGIKPSKAEIMAELQAIKDNAAKREQQ